MFNKVDPASISGARVEMIDVVHGQDVERKCVLKIYSTAPQSPSTSTVVIPEISEDVPDIQSAMTPAAPISASFDTQIELENFTTPKRKQPPIDVKEVRRSRRIAGLGVGYKDKAVANQANMNNGKIVKTAKKNLSLEFDVEIIDPAAPPPLELPISDVQAMGMNQCQIPPSEMSVEKLLASGE